MTSRGRGDQLDLASTSISFSYTDFLPTSPIQERLHYSPVSYVLFLISNHFETLLSNISFSIFFFDSVFQMPFHRQISNKKS